MNNELEQLLEQTLQFGQWYASILEEPIDLNAADYADFIKDQTAQLQLGWNKNKFMLFTNMKTVTVDTAPGMTDVMGWTDGINVETYFRYIHPDYLAAYLYWSRAIYELSIELKHLVKPLQQAFQWQVPLRHQSDKYFWCTIQALPVRLDKNFNMVVHLNIYQRMEEMTNYNQRILEPILVERLVVMEKWNVMLREKMKNIVLSTLSNKEIDVMRLSIEGKKSEQIGKELGVSKNTVMMYKKNILRRGQSFCGKVFRDADEVARYFRSMGWV
jgi:DNA-binding CsgD family transcriptional regulator